MFASRAAFAQPAAPASADDDVPFVFAAGHLGINAPVGLTGIEVGVGLPWLRGAMTFGIGTRGVELGAMARLVKELGPIDLGLGVGMSLGPATAIILSGEEGNAGSVDFGRETTWVNAEASIEATFAHGAFTRAYVGLTDPRHVDCDAGTVDNASQACNAMQKAELETNGMWPYLGMAGGFRWPEAPKRRQRSPPSPGSPLWPVL